MEETGRFSGFGPHALDFFRALAFHQDKTWFGENRALHETEVLGPQRALAAALTDRLAGSAAPMRGNARAVFRLHRDVRFAKDKRPYKTHAGTVLTRTGDKRDPGLLYIHVDPDGSFAAAGFYRPEPTALSALRRAVVRDAAGFRDAVRRLAACELVLERAEALSRLPRDHASVTDPDLAEALKLKAFVVRRSLDPADLAGPQLVEVLARFAADAAPLLRFGWTALAG